MKHYRKYNIFFSIVSKHHQSLAASEAKILFSESPGPFRSSFFISIRSDRDEMRVEEENAKEFLSLSGHSFWIILLLKDPLMTPVQFSADDLQMFVKNVLLVHRVHDAMDSDWIPRVAHSIRTPITLNCDLVMHFYIQPSFHVNST